jgi:hypothetical protein
MQTSLKRALLAAGAILLGASGTAWASETTKVVAKVPFDFVVNGESFHAGTYDVQQDERSPSVLLIRGEHGNKSAAFVMTRQDSGHDPAGSRPVLTFEKYENQYRLDSIWRSDMEGWDLIHR